MTSSRAPRATRAEVGLRSERGPILLAVMLSIGLVAIDATILATAVPSVVSDLGGFTSFPWMFSIYLLAQAISVPLYGKLADVYGRKPLMLLGVGLFLVGSLLCGFAWSMPALIVFRLVQGLGAGAVQPIGMTILGDIYTLQERATVQGYVASVWAMASLIGPTLGGLFSETIGWRWIFFVNLPLGLVAGWVLWRWSEVRAERTRHRIDVAGAALLALGGTCCCSPCSRAASSGAGAHRSASPSSAARPSCSRSSWSSSSGSASPCSRCGSSGCGCSTSPTPAPWSSGC